MPALAAEYAPCPTLPIEPGARRRVDDARVDGLARPSTALPPVLGRVPGRREVALEVDADDRVPLFLARREEHAVADEARVVDEHVEARRTCRSRSARVAARPPSRRCRRCSRWPRRPRRRISSTTSCAGPGSAPRAVARDAEVVDDDLRAFARERERVLAADPAPRAGDDDHTPSAQHGWVPYRRAVRGHHVRDRPDDRHGRVRARRRGPRSRRRCTSPSTRTSRRAGARRRPPATTELAEEYKRTLDPFVALGDGGRGHRTSRRRHRHLPRRAARADRDGQGGRHARRAIGRPVRVRRRLRLERGRSRAARRRRCATPA